MAKTVASQVPFLDLCRLCEKIQGKQGKQNKQKVLEDFISRWTKFHHDLHQGNLQTDDSFYPAMRLLLPQFEKERPAYGIKEVTLARLYIEILVLNKDGEDAQLLLNFRTKNLKSKIAGDFASIAYLVLKDRCPDDGKLTIEEVNEYLDKVAIESAAKNKDGVKLSLTHLLKNTSALEQKWLIRMITKEVKMGVSEYTVLAAFHSDAKDLYDVSNSLIKVCSLLKDPNVRLHEVEISLFSPCRPMLAERANMDKLPKLMENQSFYVETKYDGERMQLHKKENEYKFFSRNGNDYSHVFGTSYDNGTVAQHLHDLFSPNLKSCILDGEMMGYNIATKTIGNKGQNFDVKSLQDGQDLRPMYVVFDILLHNNKVLSNLPLNKRMEMLKDAFQPSEGRLQLSKRQTVSNKDQVVDLLNIAIDDREEGLVLKNSSCLYKPNARKGGWLKLKPEYIDCLMDQLDLVIIGGYFGEGHRGGMISHFLLGVAESSGDGRNSNVFHSFCKVGSGYSMDELKELGDKLKDHWQVYDKRSPPINIILAQGHKERPDLFVEPSKSFILQVKAAEIIKSKRFKTGCTLRFPRVEEVRYDKPWHQCITLAELESLENQASGKLASRHMKNDASEDEISPKKSKISASQPIVLAPHFRSADLSTISKEGELFSGMELYVINGSKNHTKQQLEQSIAKNGGTVVQNPVSSSTVIISSKLDLRTRNLIKIQIYDVVKVEWLEKCLSNKQFINWLPPDMLHRSSATEEKLSEYHDKYGDNYFEDVNPKSLARVFNSMDTESSITNEEIAEIEQKYFPNSSPMGLFRHLIFYVDDKKEIGEIGSTRQWYLSVCTSRINLYGGIVSDILDCDVSHIIMNEENLTHLKTFRNLNKKKKKKMHIVTKHWVSDCIGKYCLVPERNYEPY